MAARDLTQLSGLLWAWFQGAGLVLPLRILACVLVFPVLYRALGEPGQGWGGGTREVGRRIFFAALGALVFFSLTARWVPEQGDPNIGRGFESFMQGSLAFRASHAELPSSFEPEEEPPRRPRRGSLDRKSAIEELTKAAELIPQSAYIQRYAGIALAERGDTSPALRRLRASSTLLEQRAPERGRQERRLWDSLYGPELPTPAAIEQAGQILDQLGMGWLGRVAVLAAYQRIGKDAAPAALRDEVRNEAAWWFVTALLGSSVIALMVIGFGLISLAVGALLIRMRVLRPVPLDQHPVGAILWESFILMLALYSAPSLIGVRRVSPETQPGLAALIILSGDLLQILAVAYLWWRLRARGLTLAEIGLTTRHLGSDILIGVMAATVITPAAVIIGAITQQVSQRYFPNIAPPFHPLGLYTATSGSWEVRLALFLAAAVGAPLVEETFFRGALFGALRRRFGRWPGILLSSAFFAILHPQLPLGFLPIAAIGAGFALLADWRQSLVPGMIAHGINNGLIFLFMMLLFPQRG